MLEGPSLKPTRVYHAARIIKLGHLVLSVCVFQNDDSESNDIPSKELAHTSITRISNILVGGVSLLISHADVLVCMSRNS
jgi:hypothetical protein